MKDPEIKVLVYNIQQSLENLNNQLRDIASYGINVNFTWERDPQTDAIRILLSTCSQSVDYLKE